MEIKHYITLLQRGIWLILLGAALAGGLAFLISKSTTPVYRASSRLLIDEAPGTSSGNEYSQVLMEQRLALTYVEIMTTRPILQEIITRLDLPFTVSQLAGKISVSAPQDTQIINVSVEDTDPERAAAIANLVGDVFITQNQARESLRYAEPIQNWETRIEKLGQELENLETRINELGTPQTAAKQALLSRMETERNEGRIRYTEAFNNLNQLQLDQARESSNVVQLEKAVAPTIPVRPRTTTNTLLATMSGIALAVGLIFLRDYLDDTIKTPDHIAEDTELSTLAAIAFIKGTTPEDRLITQAQPRSPISEAFRVLRTNLSFASVDGGLKSILITSSSPGEGKSTTSANLAVVMAQTGKRVLLVDADLRRPSQHLIFGLPNNHGLTTALLDSETPLDYHLQQTKINGIRLLTSGPLPPNPSELLNSQRMAGLIKTLRQEADILIFDTPPTLTVADASILASQVDGCLLVANMGETRRNTFVEAAERLHKSGATLFGAVINRLRLGQGGYGYYYYHYYNNYNYYERPRSPKASSLKLPAWLSALTKRL